MSKLVLILTQFFLFFNTLNFSPYKICDKVSELLEGFEFIFPRDTKDQIKFCKRKKGKNLRKGDIIFWKGHVGICLSKAKFIHAYGPKKKVVVMPTKQTIQLIDKTANLKVKKVSNISNY